MARVAWLGAGVALGAVLARAGVDGVVRAVRAVAPGRAGATVEGLERTARAVVEDVRTTMEAREADLRRALGTDGNDGTVREDVPAGSRRQ